MIHSKQLAAHGGTRKFP